MLARDLDELYGAPTEVSKYTKRSSNQVQIQKTFSPIRANEISGKIQTAEQEVPAAEGVLRRADIRCVLPLIAQKRGKYAIVKMCKYENMKTANTA